MFEIHKLVYGKAPITDTTKDSASAISIEVVRKE